MDTGNLKKKKRFRKSLFIRIRLYKNYLFSWHITALQCCASFCSKTVWISCKHTYIWGFPGGASGKGATCQRRRHESWVYTLSWEDPLEEGMVTHSSILAWRIPWTEGPGGLQSLGSQRVGHDWSNSALTHTYPLLLEPPCSPPSRPSRWALSWAPCAMQQLPVGYLFHTC